MAYDADGNINDKINYVGAQSTNTFKPINISPKMITPVYSVKYKIIPWWPPQETLYLFKQNVCSALPWSKGSDFVNRNISPGNLGIRSHILFVYGFVYGIWFIDSGLIHSVDGSLDNPPKSFYVYLSFHTTNIDTSAENSKGFLNYFSTLSISFCMKDTPFSSGFILSVCINFTKSSK